MRKQGTRCFEAAQYLLKPLLCMSTVYNYNISSALLSVSLLVCIQVRILHFKMTAISVGHYTFYLQTTKEYNKMKEDKYFRNFKYKKNNRKYY